jgi:uncharacterized protein YdiU (UPF0061 family)
MKTGPIPFQNTYSHLPEAFYRKVSPASFLAPKLIAFNEKLAKELGINLSQQNEVELARIFSGQDILEGSEPLAMAYAGHQFGHAVPQLGDGRALLLGEVNGFDIHLKGSGQTPFSRRGDGRSALGPVIREYILCEAMNALGVPTTRALAAVATGEAVNRQNGPEAGGVFTRVASSHIRVGTFQYFAFKQNTEMLEVLLDYTLKRHYPELLSLSSTKDKCIALLQQFSERQGDLIAHWSSLGFVHGVMNTDNCSLAGITIDYGPCAFMEEFKFNKVFSSIDERGRYSFFNQVPIIKWNILRLAECLLPLIDENVDKAISTVEEGIQDILNSFESKRSQKFALKLGISDYQNEDESLVMDFLSYLEHESLDFTMSFRNLPELFHGETQGYSKTQELDHFLIKWKERVSDVDHLNNVNPLYIPRNHQVQRAIDGIYSGDKTHFEKMVEVTHNPFVYNEKLHEFSTPAQESELISKTFCGT